MRTRELKPGITVRVKPNLEATTTEYSHAKPYVNKRMTHYRGETFKITKENYLPNGLHYSNGRDYPFYKVDWNEFYWSASMLEKVS